MSGFTVQNGYSEGAGGGIHIEDASPILTDLNIIDNTGLAGGISIYISDATITNVNIIGNTATFAGGGIGIDDHSDPLIEDVVISGNTAPEGGGMSIGNSSGDEIYLTNVTIAGNEATEDVEGSGGLRINNAGPSLVNTILSANEPHGIVFAGDDYPSSVMISYSCIEGGEQGIVTNDNGTVIWGEGNIDEDPMFCNAENGDYTISVFSLLNGAGADGGVIGAMEVVCGYEVMITGIWDVPNDQGGWVYLGFSASYFDSEEETGQEYGVYRYDTYEDTSAWVMVTSGPAIHQEHYIFEVHTSGDSTAEDNGMAMYKVVASMNEGIFHSLPDSGYSIDNIAPGVPTGMQAIAMENSISLSWDISEDEDFQYFVLERSNEATGEVEGSTVTYELIDIAFEDINVDRNVEYLYKLAAYDYAGNRSDFTEPVSAILLSVDPNSSIPEVFALHQNYPNPFNPITTLHYDLPEDSYVNIIIYDLQGHSIKTLLNDEQTAGYRSIQWNATNDLGQTVAAGMYLYTIQAGDFRQTKKMVLLK